MCITCIKLYYFMYGTDGQTERRTDKTLDTLLSLALSFPSVLEVVDGVKPLDTRMSHSLFLSFLTGRRGNLYSSQSHQISLAYHYIADFLLFVFDGQHPSGRPPRLDIVKMFLSRDAELPLASAYSRNLTLI